MSDISQRLAKLSPAKRELLQRRLGKKPETAEPIAIVGMGCRFPGAVDPDAYWRMLRDGIVATGEIPPSRWDIDELFDPTGEEPGKMSIRTGGFVDDVDQFDPMFFGIAPREAGKMDPQQRLLLEVAWQSLEQGGLAPETLSGSPTGVFIGIGGTDYSKIPNQFDNYLEHIDAHGGTGNALSIAANRLSYVFNFHGPSMAVDTACSSALVAVHLAVQSLRNHECDAALAGGVNLILTPEVTIAFSKARMLSASGRCRPFDAAADGYLRGEGCGIIVLKRLTDAARQRDNILAVLRGVAVNQDGRTSGITAPNSRSQAAVIRAALASAGLSAEQVGYIEAHGTATVLGDPIEVEGLREVFRRRGGDQPPCYMGSSKAHVGHLETASGMAGMIKVILMMQHGLIPRQAAFEQLNPNMPPLEDTRLVIPREPIEWPTGREPRIAGVSSFGFGGTNVHVVLEEASAAETRPPENDRPLHLLALSAKTKTAVEKLSDTYRQYVDDHPDASLADICHSAATGRSHFNHRLAVVAGSREALRAELEKARQGQRSAAVRSGQVKLVKRPKVAMLFTGQGSQHVGMGRILFETQPVFRDALKQCDEILYDFLDEPLLTLLYGEPGRESPLDETIYTQPALFAVEYALAALWRSWGIEPDVVLGHSIGEYVAACIAGVFSLEDGLRLIADRARLMQQLPKNGSMAAVFASPARVAEMLQPYKEQVCIAGANGPENTVISGQAEALRAVVEQFDAAGVGTRMLAVSHAFHSHLMDPILDDFGTLAAEVEYHAPRIPLASNLTGQIVTDDVPDADYWRRHIRSTVRFAEGMQRLAELEVNAMLEVGPMPHLSGMGRRCLPKSEALWIPSLRKGKDEWQTMLAGLAELYVLGVKVDWSGFDRPWPRRRLELPTYPFERSRHWFDPKGATRRGSSTGRGPTLHPLLGSRLPSALETTLFEVRLSSRSPKYLVDHQVQGSPVMPAAAYVEQALAAARQVFGPGRHLVEDLSIEEAMFLPQGSGRVVQTTVAPETAGRSTCEIHSTPADSQDEKPHWNLHACCQLRHAETADDDHPRPAIDLAEFRSRAIAVKDHAEFYELMSSRGLAYGPAFQALKDLHFADRDALAEVGLNEEVAAELDRYHLHPALLDAGLQLIAGVVPLQPDGSYSPYTYMPVGMRSVRIHRELAGQMFAYAVRTSADEGPSPESLQADVYLLDAEGRPLASICGVRVQRLGRTPLREQDVDIRNWLYRINWQPQPLPETEHSDAPPAAAVRQGNWLIFSDAAGVGHLLAESLRQQGSRCVCVSPGQQFLAPADDDPGSAESYCIDPLNGEHYRKLLEEAFAAERPACAGIVHLWSLDIPGPDEQQVAWLEDARRLGCGSVLQLLQQAARQRFAKPPGLYLVTQAAQSLGQEAEAVAVGQSALWGMGRVAAMEHPEMRCRLVDLDPAEQLQSDRGLSQFSRSENEGSRGLSQFSRSENGTVPLRSLLLTRLLAELAAGDGEDQVAYRGGTRYAARLEQDPDALGAKEESAGDGKLSVPRQGAFQLRIPNPGSIDSLRFETFERRRVEAGQVEIEVRAAGLNFSDVLKALGLYPGITDEIVPLGIEASGIVTAVGQGVERFKPGDAVTGVVPYAFGSHAVSTEYALVYKPRSMTDEQACTIPITFLTAYYALRRLADLQPGERVLIHAGAGGVGLAAIQIAQHIGAEIFATAGSDRKRDYLRSLGVPHVMNSRTLQFADEIMHVTRRQGVDVVLNSLPGEAITKSLGVLGAYGRFLEIGKTDIYQNHKIGLLPFQDNLSYFAIDLDRMFRQRPDYVRRLFAELIGHFEAGDYRPLELTRFGVEQITAAFRYMTQRKNIGKVVVSMAERPQQSDETQAPTQPVRKDGTYLITGGLGALGLQLAGRLAQRGAGALVLLSRRAPSPAAAETIETLRSAGTRVAALQADVTDRRALQAALEQIPDGFPPLRGVVHAAGVLDDGVMFEMDLTRLDRAMAPKVQGAWNLHAATLGEPLEFFVLFSSVASVLGSPGQGNYAAGNAFLDALAQWRQAAGLPAIAVNWGPWADSGMAAEAGRSELIKSRGMDLLPADKALEVFDQSLLPGVANFAAIDAHWSDMLRLMRDRVPSLLQKLAQRAAESSDGVQPGVEADHALRRKLLAADLQQRKAMLRDYLLEQLAPIMGVEPADLDVQQPLNTLGMDSLMAVELKNTLEGRLLLEVPIAQFMESPSVTSLSDFAAETLGEEGNGDKPGESAGADSAAAPPAGEWSPLVTLHRGGAAAPLFCVHGVGGDLRCYLDLAQILGNDRPVYALQPRGIDGLFAPPDSMDQMIAEYVAAIRKVQPRGPYRVAGWSAGGIFAYEIAMRLLAEGGRAGILLLFDTPLPSAFDTADVNDDARFLFDLANFANQFSAAQMDLSYEQLHALDSGTCFQTALAEAKKHNVVPANVPDDYVHRLVEVCKLHVRMIMQYKPAAIEQPVHGFRPSRRGALAEAAGRDLSAHRNWDRIVGDRWTLCESPGDHFTMMTGENARRLAQLVAERLGETEG